jgi:hypothetical protein
MKRTGGMIGDQVEGLLLSKGSYIYYREGQKHNCDPKCLASDHRYKHRIETPMFFKFSKKFPLLALPDRQIRIAGVGHSTDENL